MRILTVGTLYPPHDWGGGYETVWRSAVEALRANGHDVRVLATDHRVPGRPADAGDVHRELRWYWEADRFPRRPLWADLATERHNTAVLRRHLEAFRPDRIAWWAMGGLSLSLLETARRAGIPAAAFVHDDWLDYGRRADGWHRRFAGRPRLQRVAERLTGVPATVDFAAAAHYAFVSRTTRDRAWFGGVPTPARSVVSSGIDPAFGPPAPAREWDWSLLYVGRIDRRKGLGTALAALEHLPEATLTVAGDGPDAPMLAGHPRVRRLGHVPHAEVADVYAVCDAVVFPVEWEEPWGLVPLEAMACGRPVLATGRGGSAEYLVDGVNSVLFAAGDAEALAAGVRRLSGDRALRERLREGGRVTARAHTAAAANAEIEATLVRCRRLVSNVERNLRNPPSIAIVDRHSWRDADADVLLFLGDPDPDPALIAQHAEAHRRHPDENVGIQGAVAVPRTAFARWLQRRGHPPLPAPAAGEVGPAYLDLRNASVKRAFMEPFSTDLDLAYRLSERGFRLRYEPQAGASVDVTLAGVRSCLPAAAQAERAFVREHPHLVPRLHDRAAHAAAAGPARGRLGRALVAHVPETVPVLGPRVWRNATEHYDRLLAPAVLEGWD